MNIRCDECGEIKKDDDMIVFAGAYGTITFICNSCYNRGARP